MPQQRTRRLAIVTPLANEIDTIDEFVARVVAHLGPDDRLITVFDKVCKDGSLDRARQIAEREPRLQVLYAPENRCVVHAYFAGYRAALAGGFDWILEMDGGLSHDPDQIPRFTAAMAKGYDYAGGSRFMPGARCDSGFKRSMISRGGTILANALLRTRMRDMTSGFECFSRAALQHVVDVGVRSRAHFFQTEIRYMMHAFRWTEVPITYCCPSPSVGESSIREAFRILWQLHKQRKPVRRNPRRRTGLPPVTAVSVTPAVVPVPFLAAQPA
ncbi:MAG: glycosyltransferase [Phycisphaerae bacterium]|nr:glycosyltransferase [Tepidisphaeraceae bacterium]